jgi:aspartate-semialdehyde dehydrogenase
MNERQLRLAIVGATGAVGRCMREVVESRGLPVASLALFASARQPGRSARFRGETIPVRAATPADFAGIDIVLSSTPAAVSREWSPVAASKGALVIDNSSAWRMDPDVPLVVPEVNADALRSTPKGIVANPNCATVQMVVALKPLHELAGIKRIVVATYQASSGKGATGLADLDDQLSSIGRGVPMPPARAHAEQLAGNCLPHDWTLGEEGYSEEEWKLVRETRKILGDEAIAVCPTTVRVPVRIGHAEAIHVEFHRPITPDAAQGALAGAPGVVLMEGHAPGQVPTPLRVAGRDEVFVGRVRRDPTVPHGLALWVVADNLRKGAATNAVQIAETLLRRGWLRNRSP